MGTTPTSAVTEPSVGSEVTVDTEIAASPTAVEEAPELETTAEPEGGAEPQAGSSEEQTSGEPAREDGRKIPPYIRALKEANPEAYKRAKGDFFDLDTRRAIHPTVQAAREEHELLQSAGGANGLGKLREDGAFFKTAAQQFLKGDPAFTKDLWEEDPIAAALHVPHMLEEFRAKDVEGYNSTLARLWDNEFEAIGLSRGLQQLRAAIDAADKETAIAWLDEVAKWKDSISSVARRAEDPRVKTLLAERAKRQETEAETQHQEFLKGYRTEAVNAVVEDGGKVFDSFFKDRKIDSEDRNDLLREAFRIANAAVEKDKEFVSQRDAHLDAGDSHAAMRLTRSRFARELPTAVKRVARRYGMVAGPAKPTPTQPSTAERTAPAGPSGWIEVRERPQPEEIDRDRTTPSDIIAGKAVLKNGRKVSWARLKTA